MSDKFISFIFHQKSSLFRLKTLKIEELIEFFLKTEVGSKGQSARMYSCAVGMIQGGFRDKNRMGISTLCNVRIYRQRWQNTELFRRDRPSLARKELSTKVA